MAGWESKGSEVSLMFKYKLEQIMKELNLNQSKLCQLTGIGKSSISQYLSGKNIPTEKRQEEIAIALGLESNYFSNEKQAEQKAEAVIKKLLPEDVAHLMGMSPQSIRLGLQQGVFPWGYAIPTSKHRWTYFINAKRFYEIEGILK